MKLFKCQHCGQLLYFENTVCEKCSHTLGFIPEIMNVSAMEPQDRAWRALAVDKKLYRFCANAEFGVCNWTIEADAPDSYCAACRHNRTIPDTSIADNVAAWRKIEIAKHRLFYTLMKLDLPLDGKGDDGGERLVFDFLASPPHVNGPRVMTGHDNGLITLALEEADDVEREKRRTIMHEPYRTLLGHFRHEVGHYFWDVLVRDGGLTEACRKIFGDETVDYGQALQAYYANGVAPNWRETFHQRLCHVASVGGFCRDLGALPPHRRHAGNGARLRTIRAPAAGAARRARRPGRFRSVQGARSVGVDRNLDTIEQRAQQSQPDHGLERHLSLYLVAGGRRKVERDP